MRKISYLLCVAIIATFLSACAQKEPAPQQPNVLMICVDDLNDWIGCMGGHPNTITPNMDKLASRGVLFTNAHCQAPICGPSRASIMSGLRPSTTGIYGQIADDDIRKVGDVTADIEFLPGYFKNHGYYTMGKGKIFHGFAPKGVFDDAGGREKGFGPRPEKRMKWDKKGTSTDWGAFPDTDAEMIDYRTAEWGVERLNKEYDKPFFLTVGFIRPHVPWHVPQKWFDMHPVDGVETPPYKKYDILDLPAIAREVHEMPMMPSTEWAIETGQWKDIVQSYLACVTFVDAQVGKVLDALDNSKYKDNTIVILWSDHGYRLGEKGTFAKHALWQEATNAPLIISVPGNTKNAKCELPVEMLDIYPTLVDLCGLPSYEKNEGRSLSALVDAPSKGAENYAITTYGRNNHAVVSDGFRYIHYENGAEELYNRENDPNEWDNIAEKGESKEVKEKLTKYLPSVNEYLSPLIKPGANDYFLKARKRNMGEGVTEN
jgi:arylsulfatase A-like enzyme